MPNISILLILIAFLSVFISISSAMKKMYDLQKQNPGRAEALKSKLENLTKAPSDRFPHTQPLERPVAEQGYVVLNGIKRKLEDCRDL